MKDYIYPGAECVLLEVWIHGNAETGSPDSVEVFQVDGKLNMAWFGEVFEDNNGPELADQFYEHLGKVNDFAWFNVSQETEDATGTPEHYAVVKGLAKSCPPSPQNNGKRR